MSDRTEAAASGRGARAGRGRRLAIEALEGRELMVASLAPIAPVTPPPGLGVQVPLDGSAATGTQTFSVASSNPTVRATVAFGQFVTFNVTHASSGPNDPAFDGALTFQLFDDLTPLTTSRIEQLVNQGFYTGRNFHRIAANFPGPNDFIVQGGSVNGNGTGDVNQPGFPYPDEFVQQLAFTGTGQLASANSGDDTNSSQFFATTGSPRFLDFNHTIFGQLVSGRSTLDQITRVAKGSDGTTPVTPVLISSATLAGANPNGVIHVDTTGASAGQSSVVTVTAVDPVDGTTATQAFNVVVTPDSVNDRPFLNPVANLNVGLNQQAIFQIRGTDANPNDQLTYTVQGGVATNAFTPVTNGAASVDANGIVTVTPNAGFSGNITLLLGVRDQTNRGAGTLDAPTNFDTQVVTLAVNSAADPINLAPIALPVNQTVNAAGASTVQLVGLTANPASPQTLSFELLSQPTLGTISSFNASTGSFVFTPNSGATGIDAFQFRVTDVGAPTPNLTSSAATVTLNLANSSSRVIGRVLVVTPPPRTDGGTNTINVTQAGGNAQVAVNGRLETLQPALANLDRLVVYGTKANDIVNVAPDVDLLATLDGGHGGRNRLNAADAPTRLHGWFGRNIMRGGASNDALIGRRGHAVFRRSGGRDVFYLGDNQPTNALEQETPPSGTNFRLVRNRLIVRPTPDAAPARTRGLGGNRF